MTDEQVEAACIAYHGASVWNTMPADRIGERESLGWWGPTRAAARQAMRAALVAAEAAAWRPIAEAPSDGKPFLARWKPPCAAEPSTIIAKWNNDHPWIGFWMA